MTRQTYLKGFHGIELTRTSGSQRGTSLYSKIFDMSTLDKLSQLVWDRLVVVDTSVAAGDGVLAAFSSMSPSHFPGGGHIIDPKDAKLYYVGC